MWSFLTTQPSLKRASPKTSNSHKAGSVQPGSGSWLSQWADPKFSRVKSQRKVKRDALEGEKYFQERERGAVVRRVESKVSGQLKLGNGKLRAKLEAISCNLAIVLKPFELFEQGRYMRRGDKTLVISCQKAGAEMERVESQLARWVDRNIVTATAFAEFSEVIEGHIAGLKVLAGLSSMMDEFCPVWGYLRRAQMSLKTIEDDLRIDEQEGEEDSHYLPYALEETKPLEPLRETVGSWRSFSRIPRSRTSLFNDHDSMAGRGDMRKCPNCDHYTPFGWTSQQGSPQIVESEPSLRNGALKSDRVGKSDVQAWKAGPGKSKDWRKCKTMKLEPDTPRRGGRSARSQRTISESLDLEKRGPDNEERPYYSLPGAHQRHVVVRSGDGYLDADLYEDLDKPYYDMRSGIILDSRFQVGRRLREENHGNVYEIVDVLWPYTIHEVKVYRLRNTTPSEYKSRVRDLKRRTSKSDCFRTIDHEGAKWAISRVTDNRWLSGKKDGQSRQLGKLGQRGFKEFEKAFPLLPHHAHEVQTISRNEPPQYNVFRRLKCGVSFETVGWLILKSSFNKDPVSYVTESVHREGDSSLPFFVQTWVQDTKNPSSHIDDGGLIQESEEKLTHERGHLKEEVRMLSSERSQEEAGRSRTEKKRLAQQKARQRKREQERAKKMNTGHATLLQHRHLLDVDEKS